MPVPVAAAATVAGATSRSFTPKDAVRDVVLQLAICNPVSRKTIRPKSICKVISQARHPKS